MFGYTYPDLISLSDSRTLIQRVNALYGPNATSQFSWELKAQSVPETAPSNPSVGLLGTPDSPLATTTASLPPDSDVQYHYVANIRTKKNGPEGAFKVYIFLGAVRESNLSLVDASRWMSDPGFVGYTGFQNAAVRDVGGVQEMDMEMSGVVALTHALEDMVKKGHIEHLDEIAVRTYLQEHMTWRIAIVGFTPALPHIPILVAKD